MTVLQCLSVRHTPRIKFSKKNSILNVAVQEGIAEVRVSFLNISWNNIKYRYQVYGMDVFHPAPLCSVRVKYSLGTWEIFEEFTRTQINQLWHNPITDRSNNTGLTVDELGANCNCNVHRTRYTCLKRWMLSDIIIETMIYVLL